LEGSNNIHRDESKTLENQSQIGQDIHEIHLRPFSPNVPISLLTQHRADEIIPLANRL
jgi:hypothetical protein